jgi:hypothetical protein
MEEALNMAMKQFTAEIQEEAYEAKLRKSYRRRMFWARWLRGYIEAERESNS